MEMPVQPVSLGNLVTFIDLPQQIRTQYICSSSTQTLCNNINCCCICNAPEAWKEERRIRALLCYPKSKLFASSELLNDTCYSYE